MKILIQSFLLFCLKQAIITLLGFLQYFNRNINYEIVTKLLIIICNQKFRNDTHLSSYVTSKGSKLTILIQILTDGQLKVLLEN